MNTTIDILLLDDSPDKLDALRDVILPIFPPGEIKIDEAQCLADGREKLQNKTYDLLILDMVIPEYEGEDPSRTGGSDFLMEINENQSINPPLQIIGLTEYEKEFTQQQKDFRDRLWYLLFYTRANTEWKRMLKQKVMQLGKMKQSLVDSIENRNKYDIGIICALSEEFSQLQKAFANCEWEDKHLPGLPYTFRTTTVTTANMKDLRVIAACADKAGVCATSILATCLFTVAHVDSLFMTGITAGVNNGEVNLDDVIIADSVVDYATGKLEENEKENGEIKWLHEIHQASASTKLISAASLLSHDEDICEEINDDLHENGLIRQDNNVKFYMTKTVCGPFVMASPTIVKAFKEDDRKFQAIDMEGFGLYLTAHTLNRQALWIKAVSDFADAHKDDSHHKSCSYASAAFLYQLLREKF